MRHFAHRCKTQDFTEFQAPALMGGDAEGGAAAFEVNYHYEQKAFLATSPQFYKQIMVGVYERAFATPKIFRGEKHATTRHLNEDSCMDFEMGFIEDHNDVMQVLENAVRAIFLAASDSACLDDFKNWIPKACRSCPRRFPVLKLREAQEILEKEFGQHCVASPISSPSTSALCEWARKHEKSDFVFVTALSGEQAAILYLRRRTR